MKEPMLPLTNAHAKVNGYLKNKTPRTQQTNPQRRNSLLPQRPLLNNPPLRQRLKRRKRPLRHMSLPRIPPPLPRIPLLLQSPIHLIHMRRLAMWFGPLRWSVRLVFLGFVMQGRAFGHYAGAEFFGVGGVRDGGGGRAEGRAEGFGW